MRLQVLVILGVACLAVIQPAESSRSKRTIGSWFSKLWKKWKKEPEPDYDHHEPVYISVPQPVYHAPPPAPKPYYPPPVHHPPTYHAPPKAPHHVPKVPHHVPKATHHAQQAVHHGKGRGIGGANIPHGFGPVKHSDVLNSGQSYHGAPPSVGYSAPAPASGYGPPPAESYAPPPADNYGPPPAENYGPPPVENYGPPPAENYGPPPSDNYGPPPADNYGPPPAENYGPPKVESYVAPPVETYSPPAASGSFGAPVPAPAPALIPHIPDSYSAPSAPVIVPVVQESYSAPAVSELSNDYRAPPSFPPPMAAHGSSSSSYLEGSFQPSQPLPIQQVLPAPPAPLYDLPVGPATPILVPDGAPAPIEVLPPAPLALAPLPIETFDQPSQFAAIDNVAAGNIEAGNVVQAGYAAPAFEVGYAAPAVQAGYAAPAVDLSYGSQLGVDDPIIEIVFQDGDPLPAPPPPLIDPDLYALPEDEVEVYFIEYSPGDNLDDLAALSLDGAQPAILHDLPQELPADVRNKLFDSGILNNAEIQVIDLEDALSQGTLDVDTRTALEAAYGAESRIHKTTVDAPDQNVALKVHRLSSEQGTATSTAELLSRLQSYREGHYIGVVKTSDEEADKFLPLTIDGEKIPLPSTHNFGGQKITEILVVANNDDRKDEDAQEPPANTNDPEFNLIAETSELHPVIVAPLEVVDGIDRQWHGKPDGWRPVWN